MVCFHKCAGKDVPLCRYCDSCSHLCLGKCQGAKRAAAIDRKPVVYAVEKPKPLVRQMDFCALPECGKPYDVEHPLQKFCGRPCQKREKNVRAWAESRYRGAK
jgi:hypothetical protein